MARPTRTRSADQGSTLIVTVILLTVLAVLGIAAVSLGSRERVNAAGKGKRDAIYACAHAARMAIWAELARHTSTYFGMTTPPTVMTLPDGTVLTAPAHYSKHMTGGMTVKDLVFGNVIQTTPTAMAADLTNTFRVLGDNGKTFAYSVMARCADPQGRELEVEFVTSSAL